MTRPVTFATNNGDIAGGEVMLFALATESRNLGCDVTIVAPSAPSDVLDQARDRGFRVIEIKATDRAGYIRGLRTWDARHRSGLLWCNGLVPSFATAGQRDRVIHLHQTPESAAHRAAYAAARAGARRTYVPSLRMATHLRGSVALPNWSEEVELDHGPHQRSPRGVSLGFLGRHSTDKGLDVLASALRILDRQNPGHFRLILAGDSRNVPEDDAQAVRDALQPIRGIVDHAGWLSREAFFESVDLAIFPSVWDEPFGLVVSEAMSARVPFVISDAGALGEVAGPGYPLVARAGDAEDLARVIRRAIEAPVPGLSQTEYERWQREYSPAAGRARLLAQLQDLGVVTGGTAA